MNRLLLIGACVAGVLASSACSLSPEWQAQSNTPDKPVVTRHTGVFNGVQVTYRANVSPYHVSDETGKPGARVVAIDYIAEGLGSAARRPVMFVFNGGPISPSVYLHMGAFGPKRVAFPDDLAVDPAQAPLVSNPHSILDVADLVYFDPAGTGLSRTLPGKNLDEYFSVSADGQQAAEFVAEWLERNGRASSPLYIFGESYGTMRAAEMVRQLAEREDPIIADGVILFGQAVNIVEYAQRPDNIVSYVVSLPTLAAIGWYHGKAESAGLGLSEFVESAWHYARGEYLDALFSGNSLSEGELARVAQRLQEYTGLDADYYVQRRLRVSKEEYRRALFRKEGLLVGRSDGRYLAPVSEDGEEGVQDDPSGGLAAALRSSLPGYLQDELGVAAAADYVLDSPVKGLNGWDWGESTPFSRFAYGEAISALFEKNPDARVLVAAGYFDTLTTTGASRYLVDQVDWPRGHVALEYYFGGHMAYSDEDSARKLAKDLRRFIRDTQ